MRGSSLVFRLKSFFKPRLTLAGVSVLSEVVAPVLELSYERVSTGSADLVEMARNKASKHASLAGLNPLGFAQGSPRRISSECRLNLIIINCLRNASGVIPHPRGAPLSWYPDAIPWPAR